ncbi:MAG: membrane protein insertion efficiency factor YidD [Cytophagales bacterium]
MNAQTDVNAIFLKISNHKKIEEKKSTKTKKPFLISGKNIFSKYNPVKLFFAGSLYFYQNVISQQFFSSCPYHISCSEYSKQSIKKNGIIKGIFMTADRLTRCNGFAIEDIDRRNDIFQNRIIDDPWEY